MTQDSKSRKLDQYIVRFPDGMRDRLKDAAAKNNRSLNAEIVDRLDTTLSEDDAAIGFGRLTEQLQEVVEYLRETVDEKRAAAGLPPIDRSAHSSAAKKVRARKADIDPKAG